MKRIGLLICLLIVGSASMWADLCAGTTSCSLTFTQGNSSSGFGSGNFGTLDLTLNNGTSITGTITLASGWYLVQTGFPGAFGFVSSQTVTGLTTNNVNYFGYLYAPGQHFDGFGYSNTAGATTAPGAGDSTKVNSLQFTVLGTYTDVEQILGLFTPGGDGAANFVADVFNSNTSGPGAGLTGLIAINTPGTPQPPVPEPASIALFGSGLVGLAGIVRRRIGN